MDIFAPLQWLANWLTYSVFRLQHDSPLAGSVNFFLYDSLKILILLLLINYIMAIVRHYLPVEKIRDFLTKRKWYGLDYLLAAIFGAITPFCSCSSIPFFVGFLRAGIPLGVTFAFLITSPLVNEAAVILLAGFFGWKLTLVYIVSGVVLGMVGGMVLGALNVRKHISPDILALAENPGVKTDMPSTHFTRKLLIAWWQETSQLTLKLLPYILIGVGLGAAIHGFVPQSFFEDTLHNGAWWTVPLATIVAVPLYSNAVGVVPIVQALVIKGVSIGTAFAFMMATVGLSLPEALILKKVMSTQLLVRFFATITLGIILIGTIINILF